VQGRGFFGVGEFLLAEGKKAGVGLGLEGMFGALLL
jgi:hypothetical protein